MKDLFVRHFMSYPTLLTRSPTAQTCERVRALHSVGILSRELIWMPKLAHLCISNPFPLATGHLSAKIILVI